MKRSAIEAGHIQMLEWAVWFSQVPFNNLREGDWVNLRQDLHKFVSGAPDAVRSLRSLVAGLGTWAEGRKLLSQENISTAQASLKKWFRSLAENRAFTIRPSVKKAAMMIRPVSDGYIFEVSPSQWQDKLYSALGHRLQLSRIAPGQIRICPECNRIFLRRKKPPVGLIPHCSHKCAQQAATRRYRNKKKDKINAKEGQRSHGRYVKKLQKSHGPNVKGTRKPRKARGD